MRAMTACCGLNHASTCIPHRHQFQSRRSTSDPVPRQCTHVPAQGQGAGDRRWGTQRMPNPQMLPWPRPCWRSRSMSYETEDFPQGLPLLPHLSISLSLCILNKQINILKSKKVYDRSYISSKILLVRGSGNSWYNSHNFYVRLQILQNAK